MPSGQRFPQQQTCPEAEIPAIEAPALPSARAICCKGDALMCRRDVWIERDHFPRHGRADLRKTSGEAFCRQLRLRSLQKPFVPPWLNAVGKAHLAL